MIIFLDMDETLVNLVDPWLEILNEKAGTEFTRGQIGAYAVEENFKGKLSKTQVFKPFETEGFWENLPPFPGAVEFVQSLVDDGHSVYLATIPALGPVCAYEKEKWVAKHLPFLDRSHLILMHHKFLLRGDIMVDDNIRYLSKFKGKRLLFDKPWNNPFAIGKEGMLETWFIRMKNYEEIKAFTKQMELPFDLKSQYAY